MSIFSKLPAGRPKRSTHYTHPTALFTGDYGTLIPFFCEPVLPSETMTYRPEVFMRSLPLLSPAMVKVNVFTHFFFVPDRIIWGKSEEFFTGGENGLSTVSPSFIFGPNTAVQDRDEIRPGSLYDYLGYPCRPKNVAIPSNAYYPKMDARPFAVYQKIYREYYCDQNVDDLDAIDSSLDGFFNLDGSAVAGVSLTSELLKLRVRAWKKDYFTSALPWAQRGNEVYVPLSGDDAPVVFGHAPSTAPVAFWVDPNGLPVQNGNIGSSQEGYSQNTTGPSGASGRAFYHPGAITDDFINNPQKSTSSLWAKLSTVRAFSVDTLRRAVYLQQLLELDARGGGRYGESILARYGIYPQDSRLQRPEYLGGTVQPMTLSEVLQTSQTSGDSALGDMAGHAISAGTAGGWKFTAPEHGWIMGIVSVMPEAVYETQLPRKYTMLDRFDYPWPELQHIGEQAIKNSEVQCIPRQKAFIHLNDETFGYAPRNSQWKQFPSRVAGEFHGSLSYWTAVRRWQLDNEAEDVPKLNSQFVHYGGDEVSTENKGPMDDLYPVMNGHKLIFQIFQHIKINLPLSYYGVPKLI